MSAASIPVLWATLDRVFSAWQFGNHMQVYRILLELSIAPLFVFPLSCAAMAQSIRFMQAANKRLQPAWSYGPLCTIISACAGLVTFYMVTSSRGTSCKHERPA
eukprot:TRINITY_DN84414_c0_g1_i1.p1 TRINITY_DN84414_c0_g1~~TRINITY_DN84414_c0_g1_i1.p1  ORF type:complete len:121 (-),score=5.35 TRINITY_DN84414_c0_g1_i1:369-680(-)